MSNELTVLFTAMLPIAELRVAIPYGISLGMNPFNAFFWAVLGNIIPNIFILWLLPIFANKLRKYWKWWDHFLNKTHDHHSKKFKEKGSVFILLFVGVPIPGSGSWTGSLLAFLFDLKYKKALLIISLGVLMAGVIILSLSMGIFSLIQNIFFSNLT